MHTLLPDVTRSCRVCRVAASAGGGITLLLSRTSSPLLSSSRSCCLQSCCTSAVSSVLWVAMYCSCCGSIWSRLSLRDFAAARRVLASACSLVSSHHLNSVDTQDGTGLETEHCLTCCWSSNAVSRRV